MRHKEELEIQRNNVTPAQFLAYVRQQIKKHGLTCIDPMDIDLDYFKAGNDMNFHYYNDPVNHPAAKAETSVSKPYEMQTYVLNWDGTVFNHIMEFDFDDEKTGHGYFYIINTWDDSDNSSDNSSETKKADNVTMNYRNEWLSACFGPASGPQVDVKFKHHAETDVFSRSMLQALSEDPAVEYITDAETGEILFCRD